MSFNDPWLRVDPLAEAMAKVVADVAVGQVERAFTSASDAALHALRMAIRSAKNRYCDCPERPDHHCWNCPLTPIWAQTIRELDCNPWGRWSSFDVLSFVSREAGS